LCGMRVHQDHVISSTPRTCTKKECA
jgi:hypothetical protein